MKRAIQRFTLVELGVFAERNRCVSSRKFRSLGKRFTLVELLVVIAIISVLAGMLLPALKQSLMLANSITCASNQKQISSGFLFYQNDYRGYFPWVMKPSGPTSWSSFFPWRQTLSDCGYMPPFWTSGGSGKKLELGSIWFCAESKAEMASYAAQGSGETDNLIKWGGSYSYPYTSQPTSRYGLGGGWGPIRLPSGIQSLEFLRAL